MTVFPSPNHYCPKTAKTQTTAEKFVSTPKHPTIYRKNMDSTAGRVLSSCIILIFLAFFPYLETKVDNRFRGKSDKEQLPKVIFE